MQSEEEAVMLLLGTENKLILRERNKVHVISSWKNAILSSAPLPLDHLEVTSADSAHKTQISALPMMIAGKQQYFKEDDLYFVRTQNTCSTKTTDDSLITHETGFV